MTRCCGSGRGRAPGITLHGLLRGAASEQAGDLVADDADLLLELGHRRIGFILGLPDQGSSHDRLAGYHSAIAEAGMRCPEDVGIIGLNDMDMARWQNIDLTTIRQPIPEIIGASIDLVIGTIERPERHPETRLFPCRVVERGTLRPLTLSR